VAALCATHFLDVNFVLKQTAIAISVATCIRTIQDLKERGGAARRLSLLGSMSQQDWQQLYETTLTFS